MTSLVAQFGGAQPVALAAGGLRGDDRASVRVTAHTFGLAAVCRVWWAPEVKGRASGGLNGEGSLRSDSKGGGPRRFGFVASFRTGLRGAVGRRLLLVVAQCSGFLATSAPNGSRPASRYQAGSLLLWSGFVRPDTGCPASLATPADAARNPEHNTLIGKTDPPNSMLGSRCRVPDSVCSLPPGAVSGACTDHPHPSRHPRVP